MKCNSAPIKSLIPLITFFHINLASLLVDTESLVTETQWLYSSQISPILLETQIKCYCCWSIMSWISMFSDMSRLSRCWAPSSQKTCSSPLRKSHALTMSLKRIRAQVLAWMKMLLWTQCRISQKTYPSKRKKGRDHDRILRGQVQSALKVDLQIQTLQIRKRMESQVGQKELNQSHHL